MSNEEQHEMLCAALTKIVDVLSCDELSLIAHCCGVRIDEFYGPSNDDDLFVEQLKVAA